VPQNAITLLTADHRTVEGLWQQAQTTSGDRTVLIDTIVRELSIHDGIEKQILYPAIQRDVPNGGPLVDRALTEHQKVSELLAAVEAAGDDTEKAFTVLAEAIANVVEHVAEEEAQLFPALKAALRPQALLDLGRELELAKRVGPTHPHPAAPNSGLGAKIAGLTGGIMDRTKDAIATRPSDTGPSRGAQ
jgi:hypothetical protein